MLGRVNNQARLLTHAECRPSATSARNSAPVLRLLPKICVLLKWNDE